MTRHLKRPAALGDGDGGERSRIALLGPDELPAELVGTASAQLSLSRLLAQARTMGPGLRQMVQAMMTGVTIAPLERELAILAVLHLERGEYEWAQHLQVAESMGIPVAKVQAIACERFADAVFDDRERALLAFTRQVVKTVRVDDLVFEAFASFYSARETVELIHVIGVYMLILRVSEAAQLPVDAVKGGQVWRDAAPDR